MGTQQVTDLTSNSLGYRRSIDTYRAVAASTFTPGLAVQLAAMDLQTYADASTVQLTGTGAGQQLVIGVVSDSWVGFNGSIGAASYLSPSSSTAVRGTSGIDVVTQGFHPGVLIDQSGTGAVTITNGIPLVASRATAGYSQGVAAASAPGAYGTVGVAMLPTSGLGSSLTAAALAQASQTDTIAGTPAVGDTLSVTIQSPYASATPGVAQTITWTTPALTAAQATSVTTAAAALVAYLNSQASFSRYFTATNLVGVVTITVNGLSTPFAVNFGSGSNVASLDTLGLSGMLANSLSFAVAATGGSTATAGGATFAGGTGYKGTIPAFIV